MSVATQHCIQLPFVRFVLLVSYVQIILTLIIALVFGIGCTVSYDFVKLTDVALVIEIGCNDRWLFEHV